MGDYGACGLMRTVTKPCRKCNEAPQEAAREAKRQEYMQHGEAIANIMADHVYVTTNTEHEVMLVGDDLTFPEYRCLQCGYHAKNETSKGSTRTCQEEPTMSRINRKGIKAATGDYAWHIRVKGYAKRHTNKAIRRAGRRDMTA